ncbi:plastocyanin [Hahella sp. CCB-MM4]|uniref:cupredoxin domain-containing protein n=1 Tax=Hahella sp. (strain CCB-MM4) TaxID=1926491 RepID=UPI000B9BAE42|nr:cupredoxin domain-containing protein [Hahella sp. CCB-MM4]OZG75342.1 plastocyanin [Hahella sp. CCB-MM4]
MNTLLVNVIGLALLAFVIYWFWLAKPSKGTKAESGKITIKVANGVYSPAVIEAPAGKPISLSFLREDPSPCAQKVVFADLDISEDLPLGKTKTIQLPAQPTGDYRFTCQMQMYQGTLKFI